MIPNAWWMVPNGGASSSGGSTSITINSTPILSGTSPRVLYDNAATVGEAANLTISSGNPNVSSSGVYLYNLTNALFAVPNGSGDNWFAGGAGNLSLSGSGNAAFGPTAMQNVTTGAHNLAMGNQSLLRLTTGIQNVGIGAAAFSFITSDNNNIGIGAGAGENAATGSHDNLAIGHSAMFGAANAVNSSNVAVGSSSLTVAAGCSNNTAVGGTTLFSCTTGSDNVAIGLQAGINLTTGNHNCLIGESAGFNITSGSGNTIIGTLVAAAGTTNAIMFGTGGTGGAGILGADYNFTNANIWTLQGGLDLAYISTAGILVADSSGNVTSNSSTAPATVTANFTADHRLQVSIAGRTYYIAMSTTAW